MKNAIIIILIFSFCSVEAQQAISTSGNEANGSGGKASYSIGQIVYTSNTGSNGSVIQGVQQPYEISIVLDTEEVKGIILHLTVYPNPTSDVLNLKVENYEFEKLNYQLCDVNGRVYLDNTTTDNETKIEIGNLPQAIYFLKIINENKEIKTFKIIKN